MDTHAKCGASTGICGRTTFGHGKLDDYGYWEFPCSACARNWEAEENKRTNNTAKQAWPLMSGKEFLEHCRQTQDFTVFIANVGIGLLNQGDSLTEVFVVAGFAVLARKNLLLYRDIEAKVPIGRFLVAVDKILLAQGKTLTVFPGDLRDNTE